MAKYSNEFKFQVINAYFQGEGGYKTLAKRFDIPNKGIVQKWIQAYKSLGEEGVRKRITHREYPVQFKLDVINYSLRTGESAQIVANHFGIHNPTMITSWLIAWKKKGLAAFSNKKGRPPLTDKPPKHEKNIKLSREQELEKENELLRAELAFIKKAPSFRDSYPKHTQKQQARVIKELRKEFKLSVLLEATNFPKATYMYWQKHFGKENPDQEIEDLIKKIVEENDGNYGYRRVDVELRKRGFVVNHKKILRLTKKLGITCNKFTRKSRKYNSYKGKVGKIAKNLIHRRFKSSIPYQKLTTDTTEFKYYVKGKSGNFIIKKAYLDPFLDMYNGEIISYRVSERPNGQAIQEALQEAIDRTNKCRFRRTIHSDQGWAYQMSQYRNMLKKNKIFQSMSRKGNCLDNSPMENFFGLLKQEMYYGKIHESFEELKNCIDKYIYYYNHRRIKKKLKGCSPVEYRLLYAA